MSADAIAVLAAIVAEVAGPGQPFSADSYLPAHLIHDARQAIEEAQAAVPASAIEAHETILLARLAKADEMIASLRAEIDSMLRPAYEKPNVPCVPPTPMFGPGMAAPNPLLFDPLGKFGLDPDPFMRLTAYGRRQECDE